MATAITDTSYDFADNQRRLTAYHGSDRTIVVEGRLVAEFRGDGHKQHAARWIDQAQGAPAPDNPEE